MSRNKTVEAITGRLMTAAGVLAIVCAVNFTVFSNLTPAAVTGVAGIAFMLSGISCATAHIHLRASGDSSIFSILYAAIGFAIGAALLAQSAAADISSFVVALCFIALGALGIAASLAIRKAIQAPWSWVLISGIVSIMCGVMLFLLPVFLASTLSIVTATHGITLIVFDSSIHK